MVILDEAQNLPARYWLILREMMSSLSETIGTHWILMSATQPAIFTRKNRARELVPKSEEYFSQLNRYRITKDSATDLTPVELAEVIVNNHSGRRILAIVNTIDCAQALYREIKKYEADCALYFLSSEVVPRHRLSRIREIKENKEPLICVSTPLIEAEVELGFDVVYRDLAPLDSLIQAAGRC
ncbi:CRISPR-associated helicase/endonuclease Cas3, partial [bacterium]|nr:CRISPR-associated helicase/endonuclease Cas3 [bacterium]